MPFRGYRITALLAPLAALALLLGACGGIPAATEPTAAVATSVAATTIPSTPTSIPTTAPTSASTAEPTTAPEPITRPEPVGVLPAPLIYNMGGQLYRLGVDGKTTSKLTDEKPFVSDSFAISEFDVSPADGSLVYLTQQVGANNQTTQSLIRVDSDGKNRTVLLEGSYATVPRFSPDGSQIAFGVLSDPAGPAQGLAGGVYTIAAAGGTPQLLQANDTFDPENPAPSARAYAPSWWSPDGSKLLLRAFLPYSEFCETAIKDVRSNALIKLTALEGMMSGCGAGSWSEDSRTVYLPLYEPAMFGVFGGLARVDAENGTLAQLIGNRVDDTYIMINGLLPSQDGGFLGFVATSETAFPSEPDRPQPRYTLHQIESGGRLTALRSDSQIILGSPLWAPDASGAVIPTASEGRPQQTLAWVPADAHPTVELLSGEFFGEARWGR